MMRNLIAIALSVLILGLIEARPADAAWTCLGPEFVCASEEATPKKVWSKRRIARHSVKKANKYASGNSDRGHAAHVRKAKRGTPARSVARTRTYRGGSVGVASYYSQGIRTASGARFNPSGMTAAHRSLPFGTRVLVTHLASGRSVTVTINDRGPFVKGRIIDLSHGAASALGITRSGLARVEVSVLGRG